MSSAAQEPGAGLRAGRGAASGPDGADAIARCREVIAHHSKSFALASRVLPPESRDRAAVVYTWCRRADDAVDEAPPGQQAWALAQSRTELDSVYAGQPQSDITLAAFQEVVRDHRVPIEYPRELLAGMEMDVVGTFYGDMDTLLTYCYRVAGTVGLMMCHVMGVSDDDALDNAVHLGVAMQITNICRDVLEDWERGRLYIPADLLAECGARDLHERLGEPFPRWARAPVARAVRRLLAEADRYYVSGDRGLAALPWRCALAVRTARLVYSAIGDRIARANHDVTRGRAFVPGWAKLLWVGRAGAETGWDVPRRLRQRIDAAPPPRSPQRLIEGAHDVLPL
ncbi:MAG: phytoene/squalene synthase family protein [Myxococcota bacterium]